MGTGAGCSGCGVRLQSEHKEALGFIPRSAAERTPLLCQRCFRIKHYNEASSVTPDQGEFLRLLGGIADTDSLVVHIIDLFDFEGSIISGLQRFIGANPVLLVVNKIDLIPADINPNRIRNWVQRRAKEEGLKVADVVLVSAKRNIGFDRLVETMESLRRGRDIYVVGATNVGKSSFVNRLISDYSPLDAELTVSAYPGTTLDLVHIPLDDEKHIIDTPGIVYDWRLTERVPKSDLGKLVPDKPLKPVTYQLNPEQTLFFGALARVDFVQGSRRSFTCYVSRGIEVHRTKLERADALYAEHKGTLLTPPDKAHVDDLGPLTRHRFTIRPGTEQDVFISGLGWIRIHGEDGAVIDAHVPKGIKVLARDSLI
ncbi:ribosome biogenesis GTPase YqeH [Paenibacillus thermotolerans]|uniref:ribosome biogenesis GTPase YqeH n=1 Tax=Paenibacillus thermotolerans TaxID=3027807 RepID=UPI002368710B|nr:MULTISPECIES: ribosome biogenesis GTPase YqeH [unclassified Paenibacillus]